MNMNDFFNALGSAVRPLQWDDVPKMIVIVFVMIGLSFLLALFIPALNTEQTTEAIKHEPPEIEPMQWPHLMEIPLDEREFVEKPKNEALLEVIGIGDDGELLFADEKLKNDEVDK